MPKREENSIAGLRGSERKDSAVVESIPDELLGPLGAKQWHSCDSQRLKRLLRSLPGSQAMV